MAPADRSLLERVARSVSRPAEGAPPNVTGSILAQSAASYAAIPEMDEETVETGFDPEAAALFEACVEATFLVANADGHFDDEERSAFQSVVVAACQDAISPAQVEALVTDLREQLGEDGLEKRARMVARTITRPEHRLEVLRLAALMAYVSGGVSEPERRVLEALCREFALEPSAVNSAIDQARYALEAGETRPAT